MSKPFAGETMDQLFDAQFATLRAHLAARRKAILQRWRQATAADPHLSSASALPRSQFDDHIPAVLDDFDRKLHPSPAAESGALPLRGAADAAAHGIQRWQQGYNLREVTREWGHLQLCLVDELEEFDSGHPQLLPGVMATARRVLAQLCSEGVSESAAQYFHLQEVEAEGELRDLEQALRQYRDMESERAEIWRQAAHDLRGNLGAVTNATAGLALDGVPEAARQQFLRLLQRNLSSLHSMLDDVTSLARLQAGRERREVKPFDAARLVRDLCEGLQSVAADRGLYFHSDGPETLRVEGDAVKTARIAQNLVLNALRYTQQGGVTVMWGDSRSGDDERWMLVVQDTGPGFHAGPGAPLAGALEEATEESRQVERSAGARLARGPNEAAPHAARDDPRPVHQERGEGIGLSIVKRLCELLDASLELDSNPHVGTTFRIVLPRHYASPPVHD
jgi:signal transduction histidine kinase